MRRAPVRIGTVGRGMVDGVAHGMAPADGSRMESRSILSWRVRMGRGFRADGRVRSLSSFNR